MSGPASGLNDLFHAKARLGITTVLLEWGGEGDFRSLRDALALSDGNLGSHLRVLEQAGYVEIEKGFSGRRPRTKVRLSAAGRRAFRSYLDELQTVLTAASSAAERK